MFYNYYLVDSLAVDGRNTYRVMFFPSKWVSSPAFEGMMSIDAEDYALRSMHARLSSGGRVGVTSLVRNQVIKGILGVGIY